MNKKISIFLIVALLTSLITLNTTVFSEEKKTPKVLEITEVEKDVFAFRTLSNDTITIKEKANGTPYLTLPRWDNEVYMTIDLPYGRGGNKSLKDSKLKYSNQKYDVAIYSKQIDKQHTEGGVEFDITLKEKPKSNVLYFSIQSKGLDFFYQPELTEEEIKQGRERPENVVGSYAVYHSTKSGDYSKLGGKNYMCGKAFHIYRPKVTDSKGAWVWGELNISDGVLSITIDQKFLDTATYPVHVDPDWGYTNEGSSNTGSTAGYLAYISDAPESADIDSISVYCRYASGDSAGHIKGIMATDSDGVLLTNGASDQSSSQTSSTNAWITSNYSSKPSVTEGTTYRIGVLGENNIDVAYDSGTGVNSKSGMQYGSWESPDDWAEFTVMELSDKCSIYATYTAGGGNNAPVNNSLTFENPYSTNVAIADDDGTYTHARSWHFQAKVTDDDGGADIATIKLYIENSNGADRIIITWTRSTDTFSVSGTDSADITNTATSSDSNLVGNQWTIDFKFKIKSTFHYVAGTDYDMKLVSTDSESSSDTDTYANIYEVAPITLGVTLSEETLDFGSNDAGTTTSPQSVIITNTSNIYVKVSIKFSVFTDTEGNTMNIYTGDEPRCYIKFNDDNGASWNDIQAWDTYHEFKDDLSYVSGSNTVTLYLKLTHPLSGYSKYQYTSTLTVGVVET